MYIIEPTDKTVDAPMKLSLPAGFDVEIKLKAAIIDCFAAPRLPEPARRR
jgi:hypothetical protein